MLESVKLSRSRYVSESKANDEKAKSDNQEIQNRNEIQEIESEIREKEGIEVAEKAMSDGSKLLAEHLKVGKLDPEKLKKDNSLIQMGMERKRKLVDFCDLRGLSMGK